MTEEQNNALRATARRCNDELKAAMAQKAAQIRAELETSEHIKSLRAMQRVA